MKKLLLITFLFLITPDAKADEQRCFVDGSQLTSSIEKQISICKKGDVLLMELIAQAELQLQISWWCDFDKTITYEKVGDRFTLACILNSTKLRDRRYR